MNISIDLICIQVFEILGPEHKANYMQRAFVTLFMTSNVPYLNLNMPTAVVNWWLSIKRFTSKASGKKIEF